MHFFVFACEIVRKYTCNSKIKNMPVAKNKEFKRELSFGFPLSFPMLLQSPFLQLDTSRGMFNVQLRNILYCYGDGSCTTFYTRVTKPIVVTKSLKHFEQLLREYGFARIHNKRLINLTHIAGYNHLGRGYEVEMTGGERIRITRALKKSLTVAINKISNKEEKISKQEEWQMINNDFILREAPKTGGFKLSYTTPQ